MIPKPAFYKSGELGLQYGVLGTRAKDDGKENLSSSLPVSTFGPTFVNNELNVIQLNRAIFVWPWTENARTKQKQQTNANRAIWLVYRTDTNARGFWLVKRTLGWKNFMPENFLEINRYFALTSYCNTIGQSNNAFSILGFSLAGKRRVHVLIFSSTGWRKNNEHLPKPFFKVIRKSLYS